MSPLLICKKVVRAAIRRTTGAPLAPPPPRPSIGAGASVGPIRRAVPAVAPIKTVALVCVSMGTGLALPVLPIWPAPAPDTLIGPGAFFPGVSGGGGPAFVASRPGPEQVIGAASPPGVPQTVARPRDTAAPAAVPGEPIFTPGPGGETAVPVPAAPVNVPEPGSALAFGVALVALRLVTRRKGRSG